MTENAGSPPQGRDLTPTGLGLPREVVILLGMAAAVITVAGMRSISGILGPTMLALMLAIAADPIRTAAVRRGMPRWLGTVLALLVVYVGLLALTGSLVIALAEFGSLVPEYQDQFASLLADGRAFLERFGVDDDQIQNVLASFDLGRLSSLVAGLLGTLLSLLSNVGFVVALIFFICLDADSFVRHIDRIRLARGSFADALIPFARGTRRYLVVSTVFGLIVAVIDVAMLWIIGVPAALLWGLLAFITNYVPNIGFVLGLIPPAILALLEGGPSMAIAVVVGYCVINTAIQSGIQPKMVGDSVGISASVTFLSLVVWAWILGPLGAILAVPLTLLVKSVFIDADPRTRWVSGLIGTPLDLTPEEAKPPRRKRGAAKVDADRRAIAEAGDDASATAGPQSDA